jgi:hypothetical protein
MTTNKTSNPVLKQNLEAYEQANMSRIPSTLNKEDTRNATLCRELHKQPAIRHTSKARSLSELDGERNG